MTYNIKLESFYFFFPTFFFDTPVLRMPVGRVETGIIKPGQVVTFAPP
jgi:hypothetical protein